MLNRLCEVFEVEEEAFTTREIPKSYPVTDTLPKVTLVILDELETMLA
ncbi:hypothetical protein [Geobacter argillaceus]|uniref:Uncharacterized protein n=1 Tax=Geobacter argillaceus TaxID=345631 RepID=A0A562VG85_9BACT|nr:hypothetical protein [Geobacter argillaceus]TWJ16888.1 hypothetical protein JN12_03247 [Geobacter argillaceus]